MAVYIKYEKYKNFEIVIHVKYHDIFQNAYYQKIILYSSMYVSIDKEGNHGEHKCDIILKEVTVPPPKNIKYKNHFSHAMLHDICISN